MQSQDARRTGPATRATGRRAPGPLTPAADPLGDRQGRVGLRSRAERPDRDAPLAGPAHVIAVDTNLLVYAHRRSTAEHAGAQAAIERAAGASTGWGMSLPCIAEFWGVVTHPAHGRPSTPREAARFLEALVRDAEAKIWLPAPGFAERLVVAAAARKVTGPRIFDLQIALAAFEAGAREIWTHDRAFVSVTGLPVYDPIASAR